MVPRVDQCDALGKFLEVRTLRRPEVMPAEERDNRFHQIFSLADDVSVDVLSVVVVPPIRDKAADVEELAEREQRRNALLTLRHGKFMRDLKASSVALAVFSIRLTDEADREATFSVDET